MNKRARIVAVFLCIIVFLQGCASSGNSPSTTESNNENTDTVETKELNMVDIETEKAVISWNNMKIDNPDLNLTEEQLKILEYFDNDYFPVYSYEALQRYPKLYNDTQIRFWGGVMKMLETDDEYYTCLVHFQSNTIEEEGWIPISDDTNYIVVKGKHPEDGRIIENDILSFYGRYKGVDEYTINGEQGYYPTLAAYRALPQDFSGQPYPRFDLSFIKSIATTIFGNNIKIDDPHKKEGYAIDPLHPNGFCYYLVTPDNQTNANFSSFEFCRNYGMIRDANITESVEKKFYVSSDFNHYIITVLNHDIDLLYIDYYDRDFNKLWSREFENTDNALFDHTEDSIFIAANNDFYIIDTKTGEDVIPPVYVGEKIKISVLKDGIFLVGTGNKDNVMKVDFSGNIVWRTSIDLEISACVNPQIVNDSIILLVTNNPDNGINIIDKMVSLDSDGTITSEAVVYEN